jgi:hypothetical protein
MTIHVVTDELLGQLARRQNELFQRVRKGAVSVRPVLESLQRLIEGQFADQSAVQPPDHPVWKSIISGGGIGEDLLVELKASDVLVSEWAEDMVKQPAFTTSPGPMELDLVLVPVRDLKPENGSTTLDVWVGAQKLKLELCPAEVGLHLRLAYMDQPLGESVRLAMIQIRSLGGLSVFELANIDGQLQLNAVLVRPGLEWGPEDRLVFVRPRSSV